MALGTKTQGLSVGVKCVSETKAKSADELRRCSRKRRDLSGNSCVLCRPLALQTTNDAMRRIILSFRGCCCTLGALRDSSSRSSVVTVLFIIIV